MQWSDDYLIGISAIDSQHKRLFEIVDELKQQLRIGLRNKDAEKFLELLEQYTFRHFSLEEKYMIESDYPGLQEQQNAHSAFTTKFLALKAELNESGMTPEIVQSTQSELATWLDEHVTSLDMEFGKYYQKLSKD